MRKKLQQIMGKKAFAFIDDFKNYFSASLFTKFLAFLSIPIFTRILGPTGYGGVNLFLSIVSIISIISTLGFDSSVKRYYFEEKSNLKSYITSNLMLILITNLVLLSGIFLFSSQLSSLIDVSKKSLIIATIVGMLIAFKSIVFGLWQAERMSKNIARISVINGVLTIGVSIILVNLLKSYYGQIYGYLISSVIISLMLLKHMTKYIQKKIDIELIRYSFFIGMPIVINQIIGYILVFFDRIVINKYYGLREVGLYSFAYNIGMIVEMVIHAINNSWLPILFNNLKQGAFDRLNDYYVVLVKIVNLFSFVIICFASELIVLLADSRYGDTGIIIPIIILGYIFRFLYTFYSNIEYYYKKTTVMALFSAIAGVLNVVLNFIFVPKFGVVAAAYTTLGSYLTLLVTHYIYVKFKFEIKFFNFSAILMSMVQFGVLILAFNLIRTFNTHYLVILSVKVVFISLLFFVYFRFEILKIFEEFKNKVRGKR